MKLKRLLKIILVIFLFCIYTYTNAQNLEVLTFVLDNAETDAYFEEVKDVNGYKCALIKVLLNNIPVNKIKFELKGGAEIVRATPKPPGELWVYLSPQTEHCRIITEGYGNINYYEFPTGPLKSTKTYIMDLRTDIKLKLVEEKINPEYVKLKISPEDKGVEVWIDGIKKGFTPLNSSLQLMPGKHKIKLIKNLYHDLDTNINVVFNVENNFNFNLKPKFGKLKINSINEITDCQVLLNEEERCTTIPCTIDKIKSGTQHLVIKKDLYADFNENFEMTDGAFKIIENLTLKPIYATINLRTNPSNAAIYINKNNVSNKGELKNYKVNSGNYFIEAKLKNYKDFQKNIILKEQENFTETIQLEPQVGELNIETTPEDCDIYLNGVKQNRLTPAVLRNIQVGSYQLELKKEGFTSIKKQIEIKDGETTKIFEKLIAGITIPIITEPSNASIEIDGIYLGISPISYKFTMGKNYNIKITKENYKPINENVYISENVNKLPVYNLEENIVLPKIEMVFVQGGTFTMGCTDEKGSECRSGEKPAHQVTLSDYYIGKYEVTQGLWKKVMGSNPSYFKNCGDDCPVENVSWDDCQEFISKLNQLTGKRFRLPTEAEWEYAARGGRKSTIQTKFAGSNELGEVAWNFDNSDVNYSGGYEYKGRKLGTHTVGTKKPNALGIYDMSGNVWEWCNDWYGDYSIGGVTNPKGASTGSYRVIRGGSWFSNSILSRVSFRNDNYPSIGINRDSSNRDGIRGLRLTFSSY